VVLSSEFSVSDFDLRRHTLRRCCCHVLFASVYTGEARARGNLVVTRNSGGATGVRTARK